MSVPIGAQKDGQTPAHYKMILANHESAALAHTLLRNFQQLNGLSYSLLPVQRAITVKKINQTMSVLCSQASPPKVIIRFGGFLPIQALNILYS